ncbi:MAG: hypothetical protein K6G56_03315 [Clostridiales bacterium]|nr:hypothetical protein [Clostridiales bacterium]
MARKRKTYEDDDGRTIADMSGVTRRSIWVPRAPAGSEALPKEEKAGESGEKPTVTKEQLKYYIFGALGAALLLVAILGVVFALVIFVFSKVGGCALK